MALGGFLLGGGHPIIARSTGAGVDNVLGHEVVLANGTVTHTSATQHKELYWGLRGSCGFSFGLVTSFRMKLYADPCAGPGGCYAGHLIFSPADIGTVRGNIFSDPKRPAAASRGQSSAPPPVCHAGAAALITLVPPARRPSASSRLPVAHLPRSAAPPSASPGSLSPGRRGVRNARAKG